MQDYILVLIAFLLSVDIENRGLYPHYFSGVWTLGSSCLNYLWFLQVCLKPVKDFTQIFNRN